MREGRTRAQFTTSRWHAQKDALAHTQHTTHTSTRVHRRRRRLRWTTRQPTSGGGSSQNRIRRAWTSSAASPMTCCSSSSASSPPNLPCGPPCSPGGGAPSGAASPSTSPSTAASATGIANAWPQSPRSFHRTLGQPDALTSACSVPTARSNPSSTSGSYPPP